MYELNKDDLFKKFEEDIFDVEREELYKEESRLIDKLYDCLSSDKKDILDELINIMESIYYETVKRAFYIGYQL